MQSPARSQDYGCSDEPILPKMPVKDSSRPLWGFSHGPIPVTSVEPRGLGFGHLSIRLTRCSPSPDLEGSPLSGSLPRSVG